MGGSNPYIEASHVELPKKVYKITYHVDGESTEVKMDPEKIPYSETGLPGSILGTALGLGVDIEHSCGGVVACSTCHIIVKEGLDSCNEPTDDELDQLEEAPGFTIKSRLACQCVPNGTKDVVVEVPEWNKNLAKEEH